MLRAPVVFVDHRPSRERNTMGDVSRRAVLGAGMAVAGVAALGFGETSAEAATVSHVVPIRSHYAKSLGKTFTATAHGRTYHLKLAHIRDLSHATAKQAQRSFVLVFAPANGAHLPDGTYALHSAKVGAHYLFLSAIGTARGMQAVVNRTR
jgi:hypothetical protein